MVPWMVAHGQLRLLEAIRDTNRLVINAHSNQLGWVTWQPSSIWSQLFDCDKFHEVHWKYAFSHMAILLTTICLVISVPATIWAIGTAKGFEFFTKMEDVQCLKFQKITRVGSIVCSVIVYFCNLASIILVILSLGLCGFYTFMWIAIVIKVLAQIFIALEYANEPVVDPESHKSWYTFAQQFAFSILQVRVFLDAKDSFRAGEVTVSFARHKLLEALMESAPQAVFNVILLYHIEQRYNHWLVLSVCCQIVGLTSGIQMWMHICFRTQLEQGFEEIQAAEFQLTHDESKAVDKIYQPGLPWYTHCVLASYFTVDFLMRLLTLGLFINIDQLQRAIPSVLAMLFGLYLCAVAVPCFMHEDQTRQQPVESTEEDEAQNVIFRQGQAFLTRHKAVAHRITDGVLLTGIVNILPADVRLPPRSTSESQVLLAFRPELRESIVKTVCPLRAFDFILLGTLAMVFQYDALQYTALIYVFVVLHVLLVAVFIIHRHHIEQAASPFSHAWDKQTTKMDL